MTDDELLADAQTDLDNVDPVEVVETGDDPDDPAFQPPPEWGQDGAGEPGDLPGVQDSDGSDD